MKKNKINELTILLNDDILKICSKYSFIKKCEIIIGHSSSLWSDFIIGRPSYNYQIKLKLKNPNATFRVDFNNNKISCDFFNNIESSLIALNIKENELMSFFNDVKSLIKEKKELNELESLFYSVSILYPQFNKLAKNLHTIDKKKKKPYYQNEKPF